MSITNDVNVPSGKISNDSLTSLMGSQAVSPSPSDYDTLEVIINPEMMVHDYVEAILDQAYAKNKPMADRANITLQELADYFKFLVLKRVEWVNGTATNRNQLQLMWIPAFIDLVLTDIGIVEVREFGIKIVPTSEESSSDVMTLDEALAVSSKLGRFSNYITMFRDQFPRKMSGDLEVMSTALLDGYMKSFSPMVTPGARFVSAYLGNQLRQKEVLSALFRVSYEPENFLKQASKSLCMGLV